VGVTRLDVSAYRSVVRSPGIARIIGAFLTIGIAGTMTPVAVVQPDLARTASTVVVAQAGSVGLAGTFEASISTDHQHLLLNNDQAA
jgi:hypothetical protein